jgi:outer membrane autotransporter protein
VRARVSVNTALGRIVAIVMPTSGLAVTLVITFLAFGNTAHAACDANGFITDANGPIVLGTGGCATAPGVTSAIVVGGATITSGGTGVASVTSPGWALTNHGAIIATGDAITGDVTFTLMNSGSVTAGLSGALLGGGANVINSIGGTIAGGFTGLSISDNGGSVSGGPSTVDNAGTISSTSGFNDAIDLGLGGTVTNRSTGIISATGVGVAGASNPTTVNNFGQILNASTGVGLSAGGTVTNALGAVISTSSRGVDISGGLGAVVNSGSILASEGRAVQLQAGGSVTNTSTGTITSQDAGTRAIYIFGGPGAIINAGSVVGGVTAAVEVESTQSSITNSGTINSPSGAGIQLDATSASNTLTTIVNNAGGAIQGALDALVTIGNASVDFTNKGAVVGDLVFGAGNAALHFYTGSSLTGNLTAGTGMNTISLNGSGNDTFSSPITNFQTITKENDGTWTLSGVVSGPTFLNVTQGTLILSAADTYTGGTTISSGTLQLGDGGASGGIVGDVIDNGTLAFDRSDAVTFPGAISGDGALTKGGASTLILTADNSYAGGTTINTGTLQVGNGGAAGSVGTGPVLDDGALVFDRSGTVAVPGAITGTGNLTQMGVAAGTLVLTGNNSYSGGTTIASGILQLGDGGTSGSIIGNVSDSGTLAFNRSDTTTFAGVISGHGSVSEFGPGTTVLTADNPYTGGTNINSGTLAVGDFAHPSAALSGGGPISVDPDGALGGYGSVTGPTVNNGAVTAGSATPGFAGSPTGTFTIIGDVLNQGLIQLASEASIGNVLEVRGNYLGSGGSMNINTFLGGDGSPSDRLVISGGAATGSTSLRVTNVGGPGLLTTANGILVVDAINGATTTPGAFTLSNGELRGGAFDYRLFQGGVSGSSANDWFLRSILVPPPTPPVPPVPPPTPSPIIGPELATYGVVQPLARQLGVAILGTLDDRVGDTYDPDGCGVSPAPEASSVDLPTRKASLPTRKVGLVPCPLFSPSVWGRFFGQRVDNHYQAFADPSASGSMGGFQGGIDLLRGAIIPGGHDRAGLYGAYGDVSADVNGLVTNAAATAYILTHTGSLNLNAWSMGGYWTHVGQGGWYLNAVLQETWYGGSASTQFAKLNTDGTGFIASLEGGVPFALPQFGPGFALEPQGQILWQKVSFAHDYDGEGDVALGDTTGPSGRVGLRAKWTVETVGGQVWQPYLTGNLWRDWGAEVNTVYSGTDSVPLVNQATMLEFGGGLTGRISANVSAFANVDYEFAVGSGQDKRNGVQGTLGMKYTW